MKDDCIVQPEEIQRNKLMPRNSRRRKLNFSRCGPGAGGAPYLISARAGRTARR